MSLGVLRRNGMYGDKSWWAYVSFSVKVKKWQSKAVLTRVNSYSMNWLPLDSKLFLACLVRFLLFHPPPLFFLSVSKITEVQKIDTFSTFLKKSPQKHWIWQKLDTLPTATFYITFWEGSGNTMQHWFLVLHMHATFLSHLMQTRSTCNI